MVILKSFLFSVGCCEGCYLISVNTDIYLKRRNLMEKRQIVPRIFRDQKCSFCYSSSGQIRLMLKIVLRQLAKILQEKKYAQMPAGSQENNGAMSRLLRVIFSQHQFELKLSKECPHLLLRNLIREKLQCRSDQLECIMEDICDRAARRHYELEIIASQVKNVENSITQIDESSQRAKSSHNPNSEEEYSAKQESKVIYKQENKEDFKGEVKIEELVEPSPNVVEGSPATGISYGAAFGQMPYSYNFLFYGSYYQ